MAWLYGINSRHPREPLRNGLVEVAVEGFYLLDSLNRLRKNNRDWSRQKISPGRVLGNDPLGAARIGYCPERSNFCVYVLIPTYADVLNGLRVLAK
jgi:hypothetical protein